MAKITCHLLWWDPPCKRVTCILSRAQRERDEHAPREVCLPSLSHLSQIWMNHTMKCLCLLIQLKSLPDHLRFIAYLSDGKSEIKPTSTTYTEVVRIWFAHAILTSASSNVSMFGFAVLIFFKQ